MCGLFGVARPSGIEAADRAAFDSLGSHLRHRGPDGSGLVELDNALLGMHRLSVMDPDHGWQPFWNEDETIGVLGNGEIYNAPSLRHDLLARGHTLRTGSDIEVIPHLFEEFGFEAFALLRGMFALLILDKREHKLHMVRDRLGEKPLCYWNNDGATFISSEQSALVKSGITPLLLDEEILPSYLLHGYTPEPQSLIRGIRKVPAGHVVSQSLVDGSILETSFWNASDEVGDTQLSNAELGRAIESAVEATCISDVPVGLALSGGLDSSLVAAMAVRARADLHAFTVGYASGHSDESKLAQELAEHLGIPCHKTILKTEDIAREFSHVCSIRDEPIADIAGPALAAIPRSAKSVGVPVLLTGIGGDELFWGYDWIRQLTVWAHDYVEALTADRGWAVPHLAPLPKTMQGKADWVANLGGFRQNRQMRIFAGNPAIEADFRLPFYEFQPGHQTLARAMGELVGADPRASAEFMGPWSPRWVPALYTMASNATYLRVNSFVQVDRLSMHYSVESRTPLADSQLVSAVLSGRLVDVDYRRPPKARMREVALDYLPRQVVDRPKRGFTPPVRDWLRAIWRENRDVLGGEALADLAGMEGGAIRAWLGQPISRSGRVNQVALRLITLELWLRSLEQ